MYSIRNVLKKYNMCVIALLMFYENITENPMKLFRVLSFILYFFIDNYFVIDFLCCQYTKLSIIFSDKIFADMSYNELIGIGIPEVLINLILCHVFTKKKKSTIVLLRHTQLVEYYLEKGLVILLHNYKNLSSLPNEAKQIILVINIHKSDYVMDCYTEITSVENTIKKLHIQSDLNYGYIHNFYNDKQYIIDELFCKYIKPLLNILSVYNEGRAEDLPS